MTDSSVRRPGPLALLLATVLFVLVAGAAALAARGGATTYTSTALLSLDEPRAIAEAGDGGVLAKLSALRFKYAGLVGTDLLAGPVATALNVPIGELRGHLSAQGSPTDLLLRVSCSLPNATRATTCTNTLARSLVDYVVREQSTNGIPLAQRLVMTQVQGAVGSGSAGPHRSRSIGIGLLAGALAAAVVLGIAARPRR